MTTTNTSNLLRLLEPAVRPTGLAHASANQAANAARQVGQAAGVGHQTAGVQGANAPFELRDFDSLLSEARELNAKFESTSVQSVNGSVDAAATSSAAANSTNADGIAQPVNTLQALSQIASIDNASLRQVMANSQAPTQLATHTANTTNTTNLNTTNLNTTIDNVLK